MAQGLTPMGKIKAYADYFGTTFLDAYMELIDMGEVRESETLRSRAEQLDKERGR